MERSKMAMEEIMKMAVTQLVGGGIMGGTLFLLIKHYFTSQAEERKQLQQDVSSLRSSLENVKKERIEKLETQVTLHISQDKSQEIMTVLRQLNGQMARVEDFMSRQGERTASLEKAHEAHHDHLNNLSASFREHFKSGKHAPGGGI